MERISSGSNNIGKTVFAGSWFGVLTILFAFALVGKDGKGNHWLIAILFPLVLAGLGDFIMQKSMGRIGRRSPRRRRFSRGPRRRRTGADSASNIINVGYAPKVDRYRVTLILPVPSRFGQEISFYARKTFFPLTHNPIISELIQPIDAARQAAR